MKILRIATAVTMALQISFALGQGAAAQPKASLKEGSKAPALAVAKWVKGKPVAKFEKGKIYVVEFWATWCGPCRQSIPHLTEMAKKFAGKVTFSGISVWEQKRDNKDTSYYATVQKFVKDMGPKMDYNVAIDGPAGAVSDAWMKAAGQNGIPTAFVIDKTGTIAWIGHPMDGLEETLNQVVAGKFNAAAAAKKRAEQAALEAEMEQAYGELSLAVSTSDFAKVREIYSRLVKKMPTAKAGLSSGVFGAIFESDPDEAIKFGKEVEADITSDAMATNQVAWSIVEVDGRSADDYAWACKLAAGASAKRPTDYAIMDTYGYALYRCGDKTKAIEVQTKAVALAEKDPAADPSMKKELKDRLDKFKSGN